jgi:hypothetical protein
MMRKILCVFAAFVVLTACSVTQGAVLVNSPNELFWANQQSFLKLTNYENAVDAAGIPVATIDVGTRLRGIFTITSSYGSVSGVGVERAPSSAFELTGIFDATVRAVTAIGVPSDATAKFELIPTLSFEGTYGAGAMVAFYYDTTPNFSANGVGSTIASTEATATDGSLYMVLGADGAETWGTDYFWAALGSTTPSVASFAASLALLVNNTGLDSSLFLDVTQAPPLFFPATLGTILNKFGLQGNTVVNPLSDSPYQIQSQDPLKANVVPEPASLAVWSLLSVIGIAFAYRRGRRG